MPWVRDSSVKKGTGWQGTKTSRSNAARRLFRLCVSIYWVVGWLGSVGIFRCFRRQGSEERKRNWQLQKK